MISSPNISPVKKKKANGSNVKKNTFIHYNFLKSPFVFVVVCACRCLPADMFHPSFSLLFELHESTNGLLQVKDSSILHYYYGLRNTF